MKITDEAVEALSESLIGAAWATFDEGLLNTLRAIHRSALEAALPHLEGGTPAIDREQISERLAEAMADSWMGDEVDCADVATILTPAVVALIEGAS